MRAVELNMMLDIAPAHVDAVQSLDVVADRQFIGHAHATVHLYRLLADQAPASTDDGLRCGDGLAPLDRIVTVQTGGGTVGDGARLLYCGNHLGRAMLQ